MIPATTLEVLFTPSEFAALGSRDLSNTVCVVFDILRATTTMITALVNGAYAIIPVGEISEALEIKSKNPKVLLGGERGGVRITARETGSIDFDFGNSPREFTRELVKGKTIVMTTTNGTRALRAAAKARETLAACFLNMQATGRHIMAQKPPNLLILCSGTHEEASFEDTLAAGALVDRIWLIYQNGHVADSAQIARSLYWRFKSDLRPAMEYARNARRLLAMPELAEDVAYCLKTDRVQTVAVLNSQGEVVRL